MPTAIAHSFPGATGPADEEVARMLLGLIFRRPSWHLDAACREHPDLDWFAEGAGAVAPAQVCRTCLVAVECREWSMAQGPGLVGTWAGLGTDERNLWRRGAA